MDEDIRKTRREIYFDPDRQRYGFRVRFVDQDTWHHGLCESLTLEDALNHCDGFREREWHDGTEPNVLMVSTEFKEGTVGWKMERYKPRLTRKRR